MAWAVPAAAGGPTNQDIALPSIYMAPTHPTAYANVVGTDVTVTVSEQDPSPLQWLGLQERTPIIDVRMRAAIPVSQIKVDEDSSFWVQLPDTAIDLRVTSIDPKDRVKSEDGSRFIPLGKWEPVKDPSQGLIYFPWIQNVKGSGASDYIFISVLFQVRIHAPVYSRDFVDGEWRESWGIGWTPVATLRTWPKWRSFGQLGPGEKRGEKFSEITTWMFEPEKAWSSTVSGGRGGVGVFITKTLDISEVFGDNTVSYSTGNIVVQDANDSAVIEWSTPIRPLRIIWPLTFGFAGLVISALITLVIERLARRAAP